MDQQKTYEMLWDCRFCGTKKLLGKTHRHCPNCGAEQDPSARYFPPDEEKVAVEDHLFVGADRKCSSCGAASSAIAKCCGSCGSPLDGTGAVALRSDRVVSADSSDQGETKADALLAAQKPKVPAAPAQPPRRRGPMLFVVIGLVLVVGILVAYFACSTQKTDLKVEKQTWERIITIEEMKEVTEKAWCDSVPSDGRILSKERAQRGTKEVPDGEECQVRKKDRGDGTYTESKECKPKTREEPVYADRCRYTARRFVKKYDERNQGAGTDPAPQWPTPQLAPKGDCLGCLREGERRAINRVVLSGPDGKTHDCELDENAWRPMSPGSRWTAQQGRLTGSLQCESLVRR